MTDKKVALVTGASRGIGRAIAQKLANDGFFVVGTATSENGAQAIDAALGDQGAGRVLNVTEAESVTTVIKEITEAFGAPLVLVNNAGITRDGLLVKAKDGEITKMSTQQWQMVIDVNLTGVFLCAREAAAKMIELGVEEGVIVNISSLARHGSFGQTNYSAAKSGVVAMTEVWAKELARYNIRTGAIAPGTINTDMIAAMKPEARDRLVGAVPLKRLGEPSNIAKAATFIFENDYFTGRVVEVDGGLR